MTTAADRNDLVPAQEKLEWVTPKISLMGAGDTKVGTIINPGKKQLVGVEANFILAYTGPS